MQSLNLTPEQRAAFADLLGGQDVDALRSMLSVVYDAAIQAQFDDHIGAQPHERSDQRRDQRNGTRSRGLNTRAGSLDLEIPRARNSNFRPTVIEHFKRSERALISVIQEAFVGGISTRKMEDVLAAMGVGRLAKSQISELCSELDARAHVIAERKGNPLSLESADRKGTHPAVSILTNFKFVRGWRQADSSLPSFA